MNPKQMESISSSSYSQMSEEGDKHDQLDIIDDIYRHISEGKWEEVEKLYEVNPEVWSAEITSSGNTVLHLVINEDKDDVVAKLVDIIVSGRQDYQGKAEEALKKVNEVGETILHRAAARGSAEICECIVKAATRMGVDLLVYLLTIVNKWGENPFFVAVLDNRKPAFIYLLQAARDQPMDELELLRSPVNNGDTVLHSAIRREHYDLAFHIIRKCPLLVRCYNEKGMTPLHILASKPSAFRSGYNLSWWRAVIYYCIKIDPIKCDDSPPSRTRQPRSWEFGCQDNYQTRYQFISSLRCEGKEDRDPENLYNSHVKPNVPENYATWFQFLFMVLQHLFGVLGFGKTFNEIINARRKHTWSVQILDELMKGPGKTYMRKGGSDPGPSSSSVSQDSRGVAPEKYKKTEQDKRGDKKKEEEAPRITGTALLVAAQKGAVEVVNKILERLPSSIHDTLSEKKNIVLVAVENRQPRIIEALYTHINVVLKKPKLWQDLLLAMDTDGNTILHLAAMYNESESHAWQIHGSAMQMQWEIKWYEYVNLLSASHFIFLANNKEETPGQIFTRDHQKLVQRSSEWLKDTSESCSVVAALVAGVSFATSTQVPGVNDDKTGKPILEGQPAFELFAVTALIGLCFSVTALIMFLSILTSRKQPKDFRRNLPLKLLLGLSSLFVSIASMLISFCAAHFFVLEDKFKKRVFPLYAATCLPASFYAIAQFPLYMALLKYIVRRVPRSYHIGHH